MELKKLKISQILDNPVQPDVRTAQRELKEIRETITLSNIIAPPIVTSNYVLIDGHRRREIAKEMGRKEMDCIVLNGEVKPNTAEYLFYLFNRGQKK